MLRQLLGMTAVCLAVIGFAGCGDSAKGPKQYPVKGTVKYKDAPLADASVSFFAESGHLSTGTTDAQGQYTLMSAGRPGAPAGSYKVTIAKRARVEGSTASKADDKPENIDPTAMMKKMMDMKTKKMVQPKSEIPEKYGDPTKSAFTATVTEDPAKNEFNFDLTE